MTTHIGAQGQPLVLTVSKANELIGTAALAISGDRAQFLGPAHVCDYQDIVSAPGQETRVVRGMIEHLREGGLHTLALETLRPDAAVIKGLAPLTDAGFVRVSQSKSDLTFDTALPNSWNDYLQQLNGKQRHEIRRKLRRLESNGPVSYRTARSGTALQADITAFLTLFQMNRPDKAEFMNDDMTAYFTDLMNTMAQHSLLRLNFLELSDAPVAAVLCFDFQGTRYLYNSAYDARCHHLSVGILSKVFSIRTAIEAGLRHYDFLKGAEHYKRHIGGKAVQLYRCEVFW